MRLVLPFSLSRFNEDDKSWEQELENFEKEWADNDPEPEPEPETSPEPEPESQEGEQTEEQPETEVVEEKEETFQNDKQNEAFARLRREAEANKKYADLMKKIAEREGTEPDKIVEQFNQRLLEEEAKKKNTDPEVLKRLQELEAENQRIQQESFAKQFNDRVDSVKDTYGLKDKDIQDVIGFYQENNIPHSVDFEQAYKLANFDKLIEKAKEDAVQSYLEDKKKKTESSAVPQSSSGATYNDPNSLSDDEYENMKKQLGLE